MRGLRRFIAYVLILGGLALIADAAITLAWQEPVSALIARHEQHKLSRQLAGLEEAERVPHRPGREVVGVEAVLCVFAPVRAAAHEEVQVEVEHALHGDVVIPRARR